MPPRVIRPKDESSSNDQSSERSTVKSSKRRVVPSACIPCRRRKSKCDGGLPACSTCLAVYRTDCTYDPDAEVRPRFNPTRDVQSLQQRNDALDVIVSSLKALPEAEAVSLLQSLRSTSNINIVAALARGHDALSPYSRSASVSESSSLTRSATASETGFTRTPLSDGLFSRRTTSEAASNRPLPFEGQSDHQFTDSPHSPSIAPDSPSVTLQLSTASRADDRSQNRHTLILQDSGAIQYLLDIYFAWVHPFNQLFSKDQFLLDIQNDSSDYFKTLLYAILAVACQYSDGVAISGESISTNLIGDYCFQQADELLALVDKPHIAILQALGIMGLRELFRGQDSRAYQYVGRCLRTAVELNLHSMKAASTLSPLEAETRKTTLWGVYTLETIFAMHAGRPPQMQRAFIDLPKPTPDERAELQHEWRPSGHERAGSCTATGPPLRMTLFTITLSSLCELASSVLDTLYSPSQSFTSRSLVSAYEKYTQWYASVPRLFWLEHDSLPHVITLHIFFNMCILSLFRPYIKLDLRAANLFPRETCTQSANEISRMVGDMRNIFGFRRVPVIVVNALVAASAVHILNLPSDVASTNLHQALEDLNTLATHNPSARQGINLVQSLASRMAARMSQQESFQQYDPRTVMHTQQTTSAGLVSSQSSDSYAAHHDSLGGADDGQSQMMTWPNTPVFPLPRSAAMDGVFDTTGQMNPNWHQSQQQQQSEHSNQDGEGSAIQSMQTMPWQWNS